MAEPTPILDEELLDAYAMVFARVALDRLLAEVDAEQAVTELGSDGRSKIDHAQ